MVLRTIKLGEADRIAHVATDRRGRVRAVVKGVRKTKSRWGSRLEPMSHVSLLCWEGRELDVVTQAETIDHFRAVREDLDRMVKAAVLLEVADRMGVDGWEGGQTYRMLVGALRFLAQQDSAALVGAFLWRLLAEDGSAPVLDLCAACGAPGPLVAFDAAVGGTLCRACRQGSPISSQALDLISAALGGRLTEVLREPPSKAVAEMELLATRTMEAHIERKLRSVGVLDRG